MAVGLNVHTPYRSVGVTIWIAACQTTVRKMLLQSEFAKRANENGKLIFFSIQGAIEYASKYANYYKRI